MFLIGAIKPIVEKKFLRDCLERLFECVQNKTSFVFLRCRFSGDNKNITQKKEETFYCHFFTFYDFILGNNNNRDEWKGKEYLSHRRRRVIIRYLDF